MQLDITWEVITPIDQLQKSENKFESQNKLVFKPSSLCFQIDLTGMSLSNANLKFSSM